MIVLLGKIFVAAWLSIFTASQVDQSMTYNRLIRKANEIERKVKAAEPQKLTRLQRIRRAIRRNATSR